MQNVQAWSHHPIGNNNANNLWPGLCQGNQIKHSARKKEITSTLENKGSVQLNDSEYPELGSVIFKNKCFIHVHESNLLNSTVNASIPAQVNVELKKSKRYKRPDKIYINIQEALQNSRCVNKVHGKAIPRLRNNIYRGNTGITVSNAINKNNSDIKTDKISVSKNKRISKLKKIILLSRDIKVQINIQKRQTFEREKMEAYCKDVNAINFNALKIETAPEEDANYVKGMSTMALYNKDYRNRNEENISEDTVCYRPDLIEQINNLQIQRQKKSNRTPINNNNIVIPKLEDNIIENDIVQQTLSLQINDEIKQEIQDNIKTENIDSIIYSRNFREYCTNMLTPSLNESLKMFMEEITRLQKKYHEKNPHKSKYKRRYYFGLKEVRKHAELGRLEFVVVAPDIEKVELKDGLDDRVGKLLDTCRKQEVVFCFGLKKRQLGCYTCGKGQVSCVGIMNYSGTETLLKNVLLELAHARDTYKSLSGKAGISIDASTLIAEDYLPSESVKRLLKFLSTNSLQI